MTESERVALAWARRYLVGHHCDRCDREWITGASITVLMHHCSPPPKQRGLDPAWSREAVIAEDRQAWAERQLGAAPIQSALEAELGDRALLPVDGGGGPLKISKCWNGQLRLPQSVRKSATEGIQP